MGSPRSQSGVSSNEHMQLLACTAIVFAIVAPKGLRFVQEGHQVIGVGLLVLGGSLLAAGLFGALRIEYHQNGWGGVIVTLLYIPLTIWLVGWFFRVTSCSFDPAAEVSAGTAAAEIETPAE